LKHFSTLTAAIRNKDFTYRNEELFIFVPKRHAGRISYSCRYLILKAFKPEFEEVWHPLAICFWYCYAWGLPEEEERNDKLLLKFNIGGVLDIDLSLQRGAVKKTDDGKTYSVFGVRYKDLNYVNLDIGIYMHGLIMGFKLSKLEDPNVEMVSLNKLLTIASSRRIHFGGRAFTATKDEEIREKTDQTVNRQILNRENDDETLGLFSKLISSRKREHSEGEQSVRSVVVVAQKLKGNNGKKEGIAEDGMDFDDW